MLIEKTKLEGVLVLMPEPKIDERGFFMRTYDQSFFENLGIHKNWIQENHSRSMKMGIIRGLHFQLQPYCETKLVRCIRGAVQDVFLDIRKDSPTFGVWEEITLSEENKKMVFIPKGFAHGFCTLSDESEMLYKIDNTYDPNYARGIIWKDPDLKIRWATSNPIVSKKDRSNMFFSEFKNQVGGIETDGC